LAKLLLLVTQTREAKTILQEKFLQGYQTLRTAVFTDKPVSMKYRGIFQLKNRKEGFLLYETDLGTRSLEEMLPLWLKKYEKS
jgi:hypothetical protein